MMDEEPQGYRWEGEYERTWEALQEDATGSLERSVQEIIDKEKRKRMLERREAIRLGIMRHVCIVLDGSECMNEKDLEPTRFGCVLEKLTQFVGEFLDQNPIGQLCFVLSRNKKAEKLCNLMATSSRLNDCLRKLKEVIPSGEFSLQNSLELAGRQVKSMPSHSSREIVVIMGSLSTCDPGNILATIEMLKREKIRCSVIGLSAEVMLCKQLCKETDGNYRVVLDSVHLKDLLTALATPPPAADTLDCNMIKMGFPNHRITADAFPSMCLCHSTVDQPNFTNAGYFCPQCESKYCELPVECKVCGLMLVSAPHLARSYHQLFPIKLFEEKDLSDASECFACKANLAHKAYRCGQCLAHFCVDCDVFIHDTLNTCPACASGQQRTQQPAVDEQIASSSA